MYELKNLKGNEFFRKINDKFFKKYNYLIWKVYKRVIFIRFRKLWKNFKY